MALARGVRSREEGRRVAAFRLGSRVVDERRRSLCLSKLWSSEEQASGSGPGAVFPLDLERAEQRYLLAGCTRGTVHCLDLDGPARADGRRTAAVVGARARGPGGHQAFVTAVRWLPADSGLFASASTDKSVKLWDANRFRPVAAHAFPGEVSQVAWSAGPAAPLLAVCPGTSKVALMDPRSGSQSKELKAHSAAVNCVAWSPRDAHVLASGGADGEIALWDVRGGGDQCLRLLSPAKPPKPAAQPSAPGTDLQSRILAKRKAKKVAKPRRLAAHAALVSGLRFSADGLRLYSTAHDAKLKVWDGVRLEEERSESLQYPQYDSVIGNRLCLFDLASEPEAPELVFAPCGDEILCVDMGSGKRLAPLVGHYAAVNAVVYRSRSQEVVSSGADRQLLFWRPRQDEELDWALEAEGKEPASAAQPSQLHSLTQDAWSDEDD